MLKRSIIMPLIAAVFLGAGALFFSLNQSPDSIVFIDPMLPDASFFAENALPGSDVFVLDSSKDGLVQIGDILKGRSNVESVTIVSHGAPGKIFLGDDAVDGHALTAQADAVRQWKESLHASATISLLGCDVAAGEEGKKFIHTLAALTEADVSASNDLSGGAATAGDWELEVSTGKPAGTLAFDFAMLESYAHTLNHFRYGTLNWSLVSGREVLIKAEVVWTNTHGHIPTNTPIGGTVDDAFTLFFGDGNSVSATVRVIARDAASNDVTTELVTSNGSGGWISGVNHTYAADGNYLVYWTGGARESATGQTSTTWRNETIVNIGGGNSSPVAALPSIIQVQDDTIFTYNLAAVDPNGDEVRFRLGTQQEFYGNSSNSNVTPPTGLTISSTGAIRWDVRNTTLTTSAGNRWQMAIMIEDLSATGAVKSKVPADFVLVISNNAPPQFVSYPTGTQAAPDQETTSISLTATDPNWRTGYSALTITALNPPSTDDDVWTGALLSVGSGATYNVDFTPTEDMKGQTYVVLFRARNSSGATIVQPVTFLVPGDNQAPSNITLSNSSLIENRPTGTIVGTLRATDIDPGDTHVFTLTGATNTNIFTLGPGSGSILKIADGSLASSGTYTVTVRATDSGGLLLDKSFTIKIWEDADEDDIADYEDSLIGDRTYVTAEGTSSLSVKVDGNTASGTYTGTRVTLFSDGATDLFSFVNDYDMNVVRLENIVVTRGTDFLIVDAGGEIPDGETKTMYLTDNNFIALCVEDADIDSVSEISASCTDTDETDFTSCIGNGAGVTVGGITCTDEGSRFRIEGLEHSGIVGTPADTDDDPPRAGGGGGGRGTGMTTAENQHSAAPEEDSCILGNVFGDVSENAWYARYVCLLRKAGVVSGYKDKAGNELRKYGPSDSVTYGQLAKMIVLLTKQNVPAETATAHWSKPYVQNARKGGWTLYAPETLNPDKPMTRGEVARTILQAYGISLSAAPQSPFVDLPNNHPFARDILTATALGILSGDDGAKKTVRPDAPVNRAEIAKILQEVSEKFMPSSSASQSSSALSEALKPAAGSSSQKSSVSQTGKDIRTVTSAVLNVRSDSRIDAPVLWVARRGLQMEVLRVVHENWAHIRVSDGNEGYVWIHHLQ